MFHPDDVPNHDPTLEDLAEFRIPESEVNTATHNFSQETLLEYDGNVYIGKLSGRWDQMAAIKWQNENKYTKIHFYSQCWLHSICSHENILPFVGFCDDDYKQIVVTDYASNGSLDHHLNDSDKRRSLTWAKRLEICLGVAKGLKYLQDYLNEDMIVVLKSLCSKYILLDENMQAKIYFFGDSVIVPRKQQQAYSPENLWHLDPVYLDPVNEKGFLISPEADVYSFGVLLFELMIGDLDDAKFFLEKFEPRALTRLVREYYDDDELEKLIDPHIRDQIDIRYLYSFGEFAYKCISTKIKERPTLDLIIKTLEEVLDTHRSHDAILEDLAEFRIPELEVNSATNDFSRETRIENFKYCNVYKGCLSRHLPRMAAIKWHNKAYGYVRFHTQCKFHSRSSHENIIRFIGFCNDGNKKIVATDYASNGSLDHHLKDSDKRRGLTWAKRLEICLGVAKGLKYLQDHLNEGMIVLRSLCSKYVLLDENMQAKICFLDDSVLVPRKQQQAHSPPYKVASDKFLDPVYLDPVYAESLLISPEADVYSFGVVLFELMSGMLAYDNKIIQDVKPQYLIHLVHQYYDAGLEKLIDPHIRDQIDRRSFYSFGELAYKCISFNIKERPTIDLIIKTLEEVLDTQKPGADSIISHEGHPILSSSEIHSIKQHGQLPDRFQNRKVFVKDYKDIPDQFHHELDMMCSFHHENIIPFIGYCKESVEKNIVFEYATNGNLTSHLESGEKMCAITWAQRLSICLGAARGLRYLHSGLGDRGRVIHRTFSSSKVLLDDNMEAKICGFGRSILLARNQQQAYEPFWIEEEGYKSISDSDKAYMDPVYHASGIVMTEVDIYPFGLVMFELLAGRPLYLPYGKWSRNADSEAVKLTTELRQCYLSDPIILVDAHIRDQMRSHSLHTYIEVAYKCISLNLKDRPSMNTVVKTLEKLLNFQDNGIASTSTIIRSSHSKTLEEFRIPLDLIKEYTKDFDTEIGVGGYATVYKGELYEGGQKRTAAFKRLNGGFGEFRKELDLIFNCIHHENVIRFTGYCDEEKHCDGKKEMIIVTEYAANGSLRNHLEEGHLSWEQRLKICLGAAKGLRHLHTGHGEDNKIIHRDVKSANILLDENMEAKICDFGLSRSAPAADTGVYTVARGTNHYMDPIYRESGKVRTASDVYSFGVVLFEMLTGKLAPIPIELEDGKSHLLIHLVRRYKTGGIPDKLIDPCIKDEMDDHSLFMFQDIAYECITLNYKKRPTMDMIVDRIEVALEYQANRRM